MFLFETKRQNIIIKVLLHILIITTNSSSGISVNEPRHVSVKSTVCIKTTAAEPIYQDAPKGCPIISPVKT